MIIAYAAINITGGPNGGEILVNTVHSTERGAMVNWLITHGRFAVLNDMGDFTIRHHFNRLAKLNVSIERVKVERI